jgi:pimeloyl-ACP methyl ester carboxylesterase
MALASNARVAGSTIRYFDSDGIALAFVDIGAGDPVLLIHGFGTNAQLSWLESGWAERLVAERRRLIALDNRGHGESQKLYEPRSYTMASISEDARRLLDHLDIERADVLGYSMGARVAALLAVNHPSRLRSLVLGGMGMNLFSGLPPAVDVAKDLDAESLDLAESERGRMFRAFVERTKGDRKALAACMRCAREPIDVEALRRLTIPLLVAIGDRDTVVGSPLAETAAQLPRAQTFSIPGRSHMGAAIDPAFIERVAQFLASRP